MVVIGSVLFRIVKDSWDLEDGYRCENTPIIRGEIAEGFGVEFHNF